MESLKSITILGSSAASTFKGSDQSKSWPHLLKSSHPEFQRVETKIVSGLTFVRSIPEIAQLSDSDLLIFHFGTSIGWPSSVVRRGILWGINYTNEFGLHQPAYRSKAKARRVKSFFKGKLRNFIKYALFVSGQYRARVNRREIDDQIRAVVNIARQHSKEVIWIQHQALHHRSIFIERWSYKRYYKEILRCLEKYKGLLLKLLPCQRNS